MLNTPRLTLIKLRTITQKIGDHLEVNDNTSHFPAAKPYIIPSTILSEP